MQIHITYAAGLEFDCVPFSILCLLCSLFLMNLLAFTLSMERMKYYKSTEASHNTKDRLPWFTNWVELLVLNRGSKGGFEDCDRIVTLCSISHVLVLQKPSDEPPSFFTTFLWILSPFDSSSTSTTKDLPLFRYPKQFMLYTQKPP